MTDRDSFHSRHGNDKPKAGMASRCGRSADHGHDGDGHAGYPARQAHDHHPHDHGGSASAADRVKDPVCGMFVDPHTAKHLAEHKGQPYYFCSAGCREKFLADPVRYLDPAVAAAKAEPVSEGT